MPEWLYSGGKEAVMLFVGTVFAIAMTNGNDAMHV